MPPAELFDVLNRHQCNVYGVLGAGNADVALASFVGAFHLFNQDLPSGARGVLCSFGAGYSIGSLLLQRR